MTILKGESIVLENFMCYSYSAANKNLANMRGSLGDNTSTKDFRKNSGTSYLISKQQEPDYEFLNFLS